MAGVGAWARMPWFPDFVSALELARRQTALTRGDL